MDESIPPVELSHLNYGDEEKNLEDTLNRSSAHYGRKVEGIMVKETAYEASDKQFLQGTLGRLNSFYGLRSNLRSPS